MILCFVYAKTTNLNVKIFIRSIIRSIIKINFGHHFYKFYLFFPYHFLIEIFYLSNLVLILLIVTYFI
jgi:hypothetical protein